MSSLKVYDPDQVLIYFGGAIIQGFADGEFITVEQMTEGFQEVIGTDGEVARSKTNDHRVKIVLKLMQTSSSNAFLSALHNVDLYTPNGAGVTTFSMQYLQGGTICQGNQAWIVKYPDASSDRTAKSREWEIHIANAIRAETGS